MAIDLALEKLYFEDKEERQKLKGKKNFEEFEKKFFIKLEQVKKLLPKIDESEIWNCHYTAYLLHHSDKKEDYQLAHQYAKKAVEMGSKVTRWFFAATLDRWLISQGKLQKFGTQFKKVKNKWVMLPVDGTVSDEERQSYFVPKLKKIKSDFLARKK